MLKNNNSYQKFLFSFLYVIAVGIILFYGAEYQSKLKNLVTSNKSSAYTLYKLAYAFFPMLIGVLLSFPQFVVNLKKGGSWVVDWVMAISVGLLPLYITILPLLDFNHKHVPLQQSVIYYPIIHDICGVVFGYLLLYVITKSNGK